MAGDWIPMRTDLEDDPAVISIGRALKIQPDHVVGKLHRFWSWADSHTADGFLPGVDASWVNQYVKKRGFAEAMASTNPPWLAIAKEGITLPSFGHWFGASAKRRLTDTRRKQVTRASGQTSASGADNLRTETGLQERTEEDITTSSSPDWLRVERELGTEGVRCSEKACRVAADHGCTPEQILDIVCHFRGKKPAWDGEDLYYRVIDYRPGDDYTQRWRPVSPDAQREIDRAASRKSSTDQTAKLRAERAESERKLAAERAEYERLDKEFGEQLTVIPRKELRQIIQATWPAEADLLIRLLPPKGAPKPGQLRMQLLSELENRAKHSLCIPEVHNADS